MSTKFNFNEGEKVTFDNKAGTTGFGLIRGVADNGNAILGHSYIIEPISIRPALDETYPFSMIVMFEIHLQKIQFI